MVFDLDGTLTDSIPSALESIQAMMQELGLPRRSKEELRQYVGFGEIALVEGAIGSSDPAQVDKAREIYYRHYSSEGLKTIPTYPHVKEMLEHFSGKTKIILSNKRDEFILSILDNHQIAGYFEEVLGGDSAPCLKPDPCAIHALLKKYNVPKERALLVGDMTVDVETGQNAGIHTCGVTFGFDGRDKLVKAKPDLLIDDLFKLTQLVN